MLPVIGTVELRGQFSVVAAPVKKRGHPRRELTRPNDGDDRRQYHVVSSAARTTGALLLSSPRRVSRGNFGIRSSPYRTTAVRGRYRPIIIGTMITAYVPWLILPSGGRDPMTIKGVIVVILAVGVVSTTGQVR